MQRSQHRTSPSEFHWYHGKTGDMFVSHSDIFCISKPRHNEPTGWARRVLAEDAEGDAVPRSARRTVPTDYIFTLVCKLVFRVLAVLF